MRAQVKVALFALAVWVPASVAWGQSLEEKRFREDHEKGLKLNIDGSNMRCGGTTITAKFDWSTFKFDDWQHKMGGRPYQALGRAISELCKKDDGKEAVKKGIKTITIKNAADRPNVELKNGELVDYLSLNGHGGDISGYTLTERAITAYLLKNL